MRNSQFPIRNEKTEYLEAHLPADERWELSIRN